MYPTILNIFYFYFKDAMYKDSKIEYIIGTYIRYCKLYDQARLKQDAISNLAQLSQPKKYIYCRNILFNLIQAMENIHNLNPTL